MERGEHVVIIPGLGDRKWLYKLVLPLWRLRGYDAHIFNFGWEQPDKSFEESRGELDTFVRSLPGRVALIGASAGGTAAFHAGLRSPDKVSRAIAISAPLRKPEEATNNKLARSIQELEPLLDILDEGSIDRLTTVCGMYDQKVDTSRSQLEGVSNMGLPVYGHGLIILSALTVFSAYIDK